MAVELNATITQRSDINHGLLVLQVTPDAPLTPFQAGQYAVLGLPQTAARVPFADPEDAGPNGDGQERLIRRAYSIASSSRQGEHLEFYVALVRSGALTPRLFALQQGDRVFLGPKITGMFTLGDIPADHDLVLVATGTGLAPYISMLRSELDFAPRRTIVVHGARASWDLGYRAELEALTARWPNLHYLPTISEPDSDPTWTGTTGLVQRFFAEGVVERLLGRPLSRERLAVLLCGNPNMIREMATRLTDLGLTTHSRKQPGNIIIEKYW